MATPATFGAATFAVRIDAPERSTQAEMSFMHIPGSDITVIDVGGMLPEPLSYELYFATDADYDNLRALVGTTANLTTYDVNVNAYLLSLKRTLVVPLGGYATIAKAEFLTYTAVL